MSVITLLLFALVPQARVIYVNHAATGANDGTSWANAYKDLHSALTAATSGDQVWIAQGTYTPTATTDRHATFFVDAAMELYGGFAGTESSLAQRDWQTHPTILSGEIGGSLKSDNSANVMTVEHQDSTSFILDGVQVRDGYADTGFRVSGGGVNINVGDAAIRNTAFSQNFAKSVGGAIKAPNGNVLLLSHCSFIENASMGQGGAISCYELTVLDSLFVDNTTENEGGAITMLLTSDNPSQVVRCEFSNNKSSIFGGGAIACKGRGKTLLILECAFNANNGPSKGGALYLSQGGNLLVDRSVFESNSSRSGGGAIMIDYYHSDPTSGLIANSFFRKNKSRRGGAIYSCGGVNIVGNTIVANEATLKGGGVLLGLDTDYWWDANGPTDLANNILWFNAGPSGPGGRHAQLSRCYRHLGKTQYCGIQGVAAGAPFHNVGSYPQFLNPALGDFRISPHSPLIDAGHPQTIAHLGGFLFDLEGQARLEGQAVDIGADEVR